MTEKENQMKWIVAVWRVEMTFKSFFITLFSFVQWINEKVCGRGKVRKQNSQVADTYCISVI